MSTDELIQEIISSPLFLKLKDVIENNPWHDHESVYDHLIKTYKTAKEQINGNFITNPNAKKLFLEFVNSDFEGIKIFDTIIITALIHDIGKILYYKDGDKEQPLRHEDSEGITRMPGHEYWGSTIVGNLLKDLNLNPKVLEKITKVVRLHDTFNDSYLTNLDLNQIDKAIDDVKARAEGVYKEALFNIYCDVFTAKPSIESIKKIAQIFNQPSLYSKREYFIK